MRGSVGKRGKGWRVVVDLPRGPGGERRQRTATFKTKREAEDALPKMLAEARGGWVEAERMSLDYYLDSYLEAIKSSLKPGSFTTTENLLRHWRPILGRIPLGKLNRLDLQKGLEQLPGRLAPITRRNAFRVLRTALRQAVLWDVLPRDPSVGVRVLQASPAEKRVWNIGEIQRFLGVAREATRHFPIFVLACGTGMRLGELLGLSWQDVDLKTGLVQVRRTLYWSSNPRTPTFLTPKTKSSIRSIPLDPATLESLRAHRKRQLENKLARGAKWQDFGLVFCSQAGRPLTPQDVEMAFRRASDRAGVPRIRFHDIRHTHATILLQAGVPVKVVSERLGHSNVKITLDVYTHVLPDMQRDATRVYERLLAGHSGDQM